MKIVFSCVQIPFSLTRPPVEYGPAKSSASDSSIPPYPPRQLSNLPAEQPRDPINHALAVEVGLQRFLLPCRKLSWQRGLDAVGFLQQLLQCVLFPDEL